MKIRSNFKIATGALSILSVVASSALTSFPQAKADGVVVSTVVVGATTIVPFLVWGVVATIAITSGKEDDKALLQDDAAAFLAADAQNPSAMLRVVFDKTREELQKQGSDAQPSDQEIAEIILRGN